MNDVVERAPRPIVEIRHQLDQMEDQFVAALPAHIPVARFKRVILTAIQNNPKLVNCNRRSLWNAAIRAAQDGLLPDGREGAIVEYKDEAQWMPMVGGIRKKVRNSGEIATWDVHAVFENDQFDFELGDEPYIKHKPTLGDRGKIIAVYSVATLKSGEKSRDVMSISEVEKIRSKSRAKNGPWADPVFYPEMAKKTVARRHSKVLPMSSDLDDLIRRDDALYDMEGESDAEQKPARPKGLAGTMDLLAGGGETTVINEDGEVIESGAQETEKTADPSREKSGAVPAATSTAPANARAENSAPAASEEDDADAPANEVSEAYSAGMEARRKGLAARPPKDIDGEDAADWRAGWADQDAAMKAGG